MADTTESRANRKVREGVVDSTKMDKTIVVKVVDRVRHPLYDKTCLLYTSDAADE